MHGVIHPKKPYVRSNSYVYKRNPIFNPTCFNCNIKGHTPNSCYMRNHGMGQNVWVKKGTNQHGSKEHCVPNKV